MLLNIKNYSREEGIRTLDTLLTYTHFPGVRLRPLGHLSIFHIALDCQITNFFLVVKIYAVNFKTFHLLKVFHIWF